MDEFRFAALFSRRDFIRRLSFATAAALPVASTFALQPTPPEFLLPFGQWRRATTEPILSPEGDGFEVAGVFNPAVVKRGGKFVMLYRAQDKAGTSRLGYAESADGIHFTRRAEPVFAPVEAYEQGGGVEDPRLVEIETTFYLTYTAYNRHDAQLCLATSPDLVHWTRHGITLPAYRGRWNVGWTKSGAILPTRIAGRYWMYYLGALSHRSGQMGLLSSTDLLHWADALDRPVLETRPGHFDSTVVEPGPPPLVTRHGILLVYNGADDQNRYATGWVMFDGSDPTRVLHRSEQPIFAVEEDWERRGQVPNVVFVEGMVREHDQWFFYYGAADKYVGVAIAPATPSYGPNLK
jgi:beta-1,2-mannosidase